VLFGAFSDDAEECPGCKAVAEEFKKVASTLSGYGVVVVSSRYVTTSLFNRLLRADYGSSSHGFNKAALDCTGALPKCHGLTNVLQLTRLPAIRAYVSEPAKNPYTGKFDRESLPFEGSASARSLQKHVLNKVARPLLELLGDSKHP
jgi:hypothetical protein